MTAQKSTKFASIVAAAGLKGLGAAFECHGCRAW